MVSVLTAYFGLNFTFKLYFVTFCILATPLYYLNLIRAMPKKYPDPTLLYAFGLYNEVFNNTFNKPLVILMFLFLGHKEKVNKIGIATPRM